MVCFENVYKLYNVFVVVRICDVVGIYCVYIVWEKKY